TDLLLGDGISNVANIVFDFNSPVITAPAQFMVETAQAVETNVQTGSRIRPNPASDLLFVEMDAVGGNGALLEVFNAQGALVHRQRASSKTSTIELTDLDAGIYHLLIQAPQGVTSHTFVKQ
ncbi:MAG TPA: T9SS type A sorting domain-containing protein, partial [Flavobacteriales bacterium]|nr:T9SS type A sorting domain-containing protein [Flavobacteriales bacterium]